MDSHISIPKPLLLMVENILRQQVAERFGCIEHLGG